MPTSLMMLAAGAFVATGDLLENIVGLVMSVAVVALPGGALLRRPHRVRRPG